LDRRRSPGGGQALRTRKEPMTIRNGRTTIPERHRPGDERVVVFVRPEHTTHQEG
jgi:hypothetical protein